MDCFAFCTATSFRIKALCEWAKGKFPSTLYRDVLYIEYPFQESSSHLFFFPYGVMVSWGLTKDEALLFLKEIKGFENQPLEEMETDQFTYIHGTAQKVAEDEICLPNDEAVTKLAISQGIAQSVKLGVFELAIQKTFNTTKDIPENLAKQGNIALSRREIRKKMGKLFIERNSVNLHLDVLDTPEFFWKYPELEPLYKMISNYLDIETRVEVLNQRLSVIHELFEMLGNELNHQHSSRLELTVVCLIVIQVLLTLSREVFGIL